MKTILTAIFLLLIFLESGAQNPDTIVVSPIHIHHEDIRFGKHTYVIYTKQSPDSPIQNQTLVQINVHQQLYQGKQGIAISQIWHEKDTISHTAFSLLKGDDLSTLQHHFWWKRTAQKIALYYEHQALDIEGNATEIQRQKLQQDFENTLQSGHFFNWHADLVLFPLFPLKENRVLKVKFHDPGLGIPTTELYKVIKSEHIQGIDCWILEYTLPRNMGYQRFWIAKKAKEVLKEEDSFNGRFRYKFKMTVSE
ncbi:MAG: hypothetical protein ACK41O_02285 [Runella zeae]